MGSWDTHNKSSQASIPTYYLGLGWTSRRTLANRQHNTGNTGGDGGDGANRLDRESTMYGHSFHQIHATRAFLSLFGQPSGTMKRRSSRRQGHCGGASLSL